MSDEEFGLVERLRTMGQSGWNPIGNEAADEIERLREFRSRIESAYWAAPLDAGPRTDADHRRVSDDVLGALLAWDPDGRGQNT